MRTTNVEVRPPKMKLRLFLTITIILICMGLQWGYGIVQGPLEGSLAVQQAEDDAGSYMTGKAAATANVPGMIRIGEVLVLGLLWGSYALQAGRYAHAKETTRNDDSDSGA